MAELILRLFGPFQATCDSITLTKFESNKVRALLAYLGAEGRQPYQRSHLAMLLWPEMPEAKALRNLRHALANLRRLLGDSRATTPFLLASRHAIQLNPDAAIHVDVVDFRQHLAIAAAGESPIEHRRAAIDLYQETFLQGLRVRNSAPWDEWVSFTREALAWQLTEALRALVADLVHQGDMPQALIYARRWVQHTPWNEQAQRQLIRLLAMSGQRSAALAQFEQCRQILAVDLGLEPEQETIALAAAIREEQPSWGAAIPASSIPQDASPAASLRFVAREAEMARLEHFLDKALAGESQFVFITGVAGSGKSALAAAFGRRALKQQGSAVVAWGESNAFAGHGDPFLPFRDILLTLIEDATAMQRGMALGEGYSRRLQRFSPAVIPILLDEGGDLIDALALRTTLILQTEAFFAPGARKQTLLRQLRQQHHPVANPTPPPEHHFAQFTQILRQLARQAPLILILDDLQWADAGSLSLLYHLGRRLRTSRILVLGLFRSEEVLNLTSGADEHPLARMLREFQRRRGDILIDLNQSAGRDFIDAYLDAEPNRLDEAFRQQLYRHTGGHALFTVELLASLREQGYLIKTAEGWRSRDDLAWTQLPPRVEAIIAERMARLPERWRTLLSAASVATDDFSAEALAQMLDWPLGEVHRILNALTTPPSQLLTFRGRSLGDNQMLSVYRFRHILFQTFLYDHMTPGEQQYWHEKMGLAQETLYGAQVASLAPAQARHFEIAQLPLKAAHYYLLAGQRAMQLFAPDKALALYSRGLTLLQDVPDSQERAEQEMALQMASSTPLLVMTGWGAAERDRACRRAYELCEQTGDELALMKALYLEADRLRAHGDYAHSLLLSHQLLEQATQNENSVGLALAHWTLGETYLFQGDLTPARHHLTQALHYNTYRESDPIPITATDLTVVCHVWLAWLELLTGHRQTGETHLQAALARSRTLDQPLSLIFALTLGAYGVNWLLDRPRAAAAYADELAPLMADPALAGMHPWGQVFQGWALAETGSLAEGIAMMEAGMRAWREAGALSGLSCQGLPLARAYLRAGRKAEARSLIQAMQTLIEAQNERLFESDWRALADALRHET